MGRVEVGVVWNGMRSEWVELILGWSGAGFTVLGWFAVWVGHGGVGMGVGWAIVGLG